MLNKASDDLIIYIPLPPYMDRVDLISGNEKIRKDLQAWTRSQLAKRSKDSLTSRMDLVVIYIDKKGRPVLPDKESRIALSGQSERNANTNLEFTFNSPDEPFTDEELTRLQSYVRDIYPVIRSIVGTPFFNNTVNVRQDASIGYSGFYNVSLNEMVLRAPAADVFCHEAIHAFRDDYIMRSSVYEEGMTRASEVEVFNELPDSFSHWDRFHSYTYDVYYEALNQPELTTLGANVNASSGLILLRYQVSSYVWTKAFLEDHNFIKRFNDSLYTRTVVDNNTPYAMEKLVSIFETVKPVIEDMPFREWHKNQYILQTVPVQGYRLFHRVGNFIIDYLFKGNAGYETPQQGAVVYWQTLDHNNQTISSGSAVSNAYGTIAFDPGLSGLSYNGRLKIIAWTTSPEGEVRDTTFYPAFAYPDARGIIGVVEDGNSGSISITPLDTVMGTVKANVVNGVFYFPTLEKVRGRFKCVLTYPNGTSLTSTVTKDRSHYFLSFRTIPSAVLPLRLVNFSATYDEPAVLLRWQSENEENTGWFYIERSIDNRTFSTVGKIEAAHYSTQSIQYEFSDQQAFALGIDKVYYRLKEEDQDGKVIYSKTVPVDISRSTLFSIWPNPALSHITIRLKNGLLSTPARVIITDSRGRQVKAGEMRWNSRDGSLNISVQHLPAGIYYLSVLTGGRPLHASFVKQ